MKKVNVEFVPMDARLMEARREALVGLPADDRVYSAVVLVLQEQRARYWIAAENGEAMASERARAVGACLHALEDLRLGNVPGPRAPRSK